MWRPVKARETFAGMSEVRDIGNVGGSMFTNSATAKF